MLAFLGWLAWPSDPGPGPYVLSHSDGKARFYATTYRQQTGPWPSFTVPQRLGWAWMQFKRRYIKPNPAAYTFPARPIVPCAIVPFLDQCMEFSGKQYLIAVEIIGEVEFGPTNKMNGTQWVAAFEHALETSGPVTCYDSARKEFFKDTLLLIREGPRLVKVVPCSKLAEYQKAGLVRADSP
jgi:hypothetical protein